MLAEKHGWITCIAAIQRSAAGTGWQAAPPARGPGTWAFAISSVRRDLLVQLMRQYPGPVQSAGGGGSRDRKAQATLLATCCCGSSLDNTAKTDLDAQANEEPKTRVAEGPFGSRRLALPRRQRDLESAYTPPSQVARGANLNLSTLINSSWE
jgi:hypothetical protein